MPKEKDTNISRLEEAYVEFQKQHDGDHPAKIILNPRWEVEYLRQHPMARSWKKLYLADLYFVSECPDYWIEEKGTNLQDLKQGLNRILAFHGLPPLEDSFPQSDSLTAAGRRAYERILLIEKCAMIPERMLAELGLKTKQSCKTEVLV